MHASSLPIVTNSSHGSLLLNQIDGFVDFTAANHAWNILHTGDDAETLASVDFTPASVRSIAEDKFQWHDRKDDLVKEAVDNAVVHIALGILDGKKHPVSLDRVMTDDVTRLIEGAIRNNITELFGVVGDLLEGDLYRVNLAAVCLRLV